MLKVGAGFGKKICIVPFGFLLACVIAGLAKADSSVPYVGCPGSSMAQDSVIPPPGHPISLDLSPAIAARLAFYYGQNLFALAPRGWLCSSQTNNTGGDLSIQPPNGNYDTGPGIFLNNWSADPTGWWEMAAYGGTYFPKIYTPQDMAAVVSSFNNQGGGSTKAKFLAPKFAHDKLTYLDSSTLEYITPPKMTGLGSLVLAGGPSTWIGGKNYDGNQVKPSKLWTYGVMTLIKTPNDQFMNIFVVRLPPGMDLLRSAIMDFSAHCQPFDPSAACSSQINFGQ